MKGRRSSNTSAGIVSELIYEQGAFPHRRMRRRRHCPASWPSLASTIARGQGPLRVLSGMLAPVCVGCRHRTSRPRDSALIASPEELLGRPRIGVVVRRRLGRRPALNCAILASVTGLSSRPSAYYSAPVHRFLRFGPAPGPRCTRCGSHARPGRRAASSMGRRNRHPPRCSEWTRRHGLPGVRRATTWEPS